ncbi:hypothetical protein LSTR_LSTR010705, partial [Laodelphax striatellus]
MHWWSEMNGGSSSRWIHSILIRCDVGALQVPSQHRDCPGEEVVSCQPVGHVSSGIRIM